MLRDVFQNHLMQLLSIVAMEPPEGFDPRATHAEKIKVLNAIRPFPSADLGRYIVRGQYGSGSAVPGYRQEKDIPDDSSVETFVAAKIFIDNERWKGVPFYVRCGKRLPVQAVEIVVAFKGGAEAQVPDVLFIRIQPSPGIFLRTVSNALNTEMYPAPNFGKSLPEAYEKLLFDCLQGDRSSFVDVDEHFAAWRLLTPVIDHWKTSWPKTFPNYAAGTWGPVDADALLHEDGRQWLVLIDFISK
jgi:glucose-6-phosphate 1-dehydrogenase